LYELSGKPDKKDEITKMITETPSDTKVEDYVETDSALGYLTELKKYTGVLSNLYKSMLETQIAIVSKIVGDSAAAEASTSTTSVSTGTTEQGTDVIKGGKKTRRNKQTHLKRTFREH
jgi:hypothetical protein